MEVNEQDKSNEQLVLQRVGLKWPLVIHKKFTATVEKSAIFDFEGINAFLDVKVRDCASNQFPTVILSKEKGDTVLNQPKPDYYMIYYYTVDRVVRIFYLNACKLILNTNYEYFHKRRQEYDVKTIYEVNKRDAFTDIKGEDIGL